MARSRVSMKQGIEAFLSMTFDLENVKPYRTQRDAREDAMRMVGFSQAQERLRDILAQCESATAAELSQVIPDGALRPVEYGGRFRGWTPPELPTR